ncbi:MAG TPA: DUF4350 domain-containing protein [Dongiaceae bacterium]|jgi:hypothetical protein
MNQAEQMEARRASEVFSPRTLIIVIAVGVLAFVGMLYLQLFGAAGDPDFEVGPSTYSRSAIGHKALLETLRRLDIPVVVSRFKSGEKANSGSLLVLAEPDISEAPDTLLGEFGDMPHGLLVMPKWQGVRDRQKPRWVGRMILVDPGRVTSILKEAQVGGKPKRLKGTFTVNVPQMGGTIELSDPQVIVESNLKPVVTLRDGILIGEAQSDSGQQWVLSDPDLIANYGIDQKDNAVVAVSLIEHLRPRSGVVIFDETIHGFEQRPNLLKSAFKLPFSIVTLSTAVVLLLAIWAGVTRFGRPEPEGRALRSGKVTLIGTTADLMRQASRKSGAVELILTRYLRAQIADMVARVNAPRGLSDMQQVALLDSLAEARRLKLPPLGQAVEAVRGEAKDAARSTRFAAQLHAWKQEFLHGIGTGSGDR